MDIDIDVFGSREVNINPQERKRKKRIDDYDYTDPFIEQFEGEDDAVELEPHIENFFMYEGSLPERASKVLSTHARASKKTSNKKEAPARPLDVIYCMQNLIYSKMLENACSESDVADFLLYDLIINHDFNFERAKERTASLGTTILLSTDLIRSEIDKLQSSLVSLHENIASILSEDDTYDGSNVVFIDKLCDAVFHYIDAKVKTEAYVMEVESNKKINYNSVRKNAYTQVYSLLREGTKNYKQLGYHVYKYTRKQKIGRYNGFKPEYLTTKREKDLQFERISGTFSSTEEFKKSQEFLDNHARDCKEEDTYTRPSAWCEESNERGTNTLHKGEMQVYTACALKEDVICGNNSCSIQKVESQWLETMQDNAKGDISDSRDDN